MFIFSMWYIKYKCNSCNITNINCTMWQFIIEPQQSTGFNNN